MKLYYELYQISMNLNILLMVKSFFYLINLSLLTFYCDAYIFILYLDPHVFYLFIYLFVQEFEANLIFAAFF